MPEWMKDIYIKVLKGNKLIKDLRVTSGSWYRPRTYVIGTFLMLKDDLPVQEWINRCRNG